jgi:hypothetical protein
MKNAKRMIALVIALVLAVSVFTACGENKDEKKNEAAITATAVKFSKDGKYTTTVKSDTIDLSDISAKNVEISTAANNEVKVESVKANSNGSYDITFTDENGERVSYGEQKEWTRTIEYVFPDDSSRNHTVRYQGGSTTTSSRHSGTVKSPPFCRQETRIRYVPSDRAGSRRRASSLSKVRVCVPSTV